MNDDRKLTDADVAAIVDALETRITEKFYADIGRGVWGYVRKAFVMIVIAVAAYGALRGFK